MRSAFYALARGGRPLPSLMRCALVGWLVIAAHTAAAQSAVDGVCGNPFQNHFGPFDFRRAPPYALMLVERKHLTPGIESLTQPGTTTLHLLASDVGYTLHVFPNHHRALITMVRLGERHKSDQPPGARYTIDCYFQRGMQYTPTDQLVRVIFATHLVKTNRKDQAITLLDDVLQRIDNPMTHHTIGMIYLDMGEPDRALVQAHRAAVLGDPRKTLEDALKAKGTWREPGPAN